VNVYAGLYALTISWLALRTSSFCPSWPMASDSFLPVMAVGFCVLAVLAPAITLFNPGKILDHAPPLSGRELLRMRGLLVIGILASVFAPDCFAFASEGRDWWDRVAFLHPSQQNTGILHQFVCSLCQRGFNGEPPMWTSWGRSFPSDCSFLCCSVLSSCHTTLFYRIVLVRKRRELLQFLRRIEKRKDTMQISVKA
jgi:hypothetical protein